MLAFTTKQLNDIYEFVGNLMAFDSLIMCHRLYVKLDMRKFANVIYVDEYWNYKID